MLFISLEMALTSWTAIDFLGFFHLGCALGLYLLHAIQMLFRREDLEYSCWEFGNILSMLFTAVLSSSFLVWGWYQVLVEDSLLNAEEQIKIWNFGCSCLTRQFSYLLILGLQVEMAENSALSVFILLQMVEFEPKFTHLEVKNVVFSLPVSGEITEVLKKRQFLMSALLLCCSFVIHRNAFLILPHIPGLEE